MSQALNITAPDLAARVESMSPEERDVLPFGAIALNADGVVLWFSQRERDLSGYRKEPVGKRFFTDVAPCMNTSFFAGRIEAARRAGTLNIAFSCVGDFNDRNRALDVRVQSSSNGGMWIFIQRPEVK